MFGPLDWMMEEYGLTRSQARKKRRRQFKRTRRERQRQGLHAHYIDAGKCASCGFRPWVRWGNSLVFSKPWRYADCYCERARGYSPKGSAVEALRIWQIGREQHRHRLENPTGRVLDREAGLRYQRYERKEMEIIEISGRGEYRG